ncbi:GNAT superfamily N-acetyltransferase [Saccharothrix ecbatanensis]|uniref:GNAT superfamily N-acetyltransferase n=1 Tax=Saccharothrix ecbatanensis TaxID=1105145 RepID=A0A7W9HQU1_9PSEU|nr:N-acetyltransferase [Saccharothrix ecbatanensis]MBB5806748.1 GNAT superfamily N-acetyltransferase [Saccharothrix ecbatanensis]
MTDWVSSALAPLHDLTDFDCGVHEFNDWLRGHAVNAIARGTARTYVWTPLGNDRVVAYYSVVPHLVARTELTTSFAGGLGAAVPGYLLAKLALDQTLHGRGLGAELLRDAMKTVVFAADVASGRLLMVDAIDDHAAAFYRKHEFRPTAGNPLRLVVKIATLRKALGLQVHAATGL